MGTDATVDAAIDNYLKHYEKSIGNVWRRTEAGESPEDIAGFRGTSTSDFVRRDLRIIRVMKDPSIESAIWYKLRAARELEELLASDSLDLAVRALLREHVLLLRRAAVGVEVIEERQRRAFIWEELGRLSKERIVRPGDLHRLGRYIRGSGAWWRVGRSLRCFERQLSLRPFRRWVGQPPMSTILGGPRRLGFPRP